MSVPEFSVKRPVFIGMCASIVVILGGVALKSLPVDLMPEITYPAISINTTYEDASPEEVEQLISRPIEETVSAVSGVDTVSSSSSEGTSSVVIEFTWGTNLDEAASDVRDRIDRIIARLPDDADRPTLRKFDSASTPIVRLGIGTDLDLMEARELLDDQVVYRLAAFGHGLHAVDGAGHSHLDGLYLGCAVVNGVEHGGDVILLAVVGIVLHGLVVAEELYLLAVGGGIFGFGAAVSLDANDGTQREEDGAVQEFVGLPLEEQRHGEVDGLQSREVEVGTLGAGHDAYFPLLFDEVAVFVHDVVAPVDAQSGNKAPTVVVNGGVKGNEIPKNFKRIGEVERDPVG